MFEFDPDKYSKVDVVDYSKTYQGKPTSEDFGNIRVDVFETEQEMLEFSKKFLKNNFHENSFFTSMLIVKRMLFNNLFQKKKDIIEEEEEGFNKNIYEVRYEKLYQFRTLQFIIKSLILFFSKMKDLSNALETLKIFFSFELAEREIKQIFKNLDKFFKIDKQYLSGTKLKINHNPNP
jgi:hypothetical protein